MSRSLAAALGLIAAGICLAALSPPRGRCGEAYVVARGDTLSHIARRCRSSVLAIARASRVANPDRIEIGQRLTIPNGERMAAAPGDGHRRHAAAAAQQPGYRFARSDTLYSLARWARVSVPALLAANPGIDPHKIEIGDIVRLPAGAALPYAARLRERGPAPVRYESPVRYAPPARDEPRREERRDEADEPDPDKEPEPEGM